MRHCHKCRKTKPSSQFRLRADGEGFYHWCDTCTTRQERYNDVSAPDADMELTNRVRASRPVSERLQEICRT